jgi:hypothetical protein
MPPERSKQCAGGVLGRMIVDGPTIRGSTCACTSYHANRAIVGMTQHTRETERNTASTPAAIFLSISMVTGHRCGVQRPGCGDFDISRLSTFQDTSRFKDFKLCSP